MGVNFLLLKKKKEGVSNNFEVFNFFVRNVIFVVFFGYRDVFEVGVFD